MSKERPLQSIEDVIGPRWTEEDISNIWFQQDGATYHTAEATLDVLRPVFEDRIISRRTDVFWLPRSCDLTPLQYYLWGAVKDKCYADKPETIDALKYNFREAIKAKYFISIIEFIEKILNLNWLKNVFC